MEAGAQVYNIPLLKHCPERHTSQSPSKRDYDIKLPELTTTTTQFRKEQMKRQKNLFARIMQTKLLTAELDLNKRSTTVSDDFI